MLSFQIELRSGKHVSLDCAASEQYCKNPNSLLEFFVDACRKKGLKSPNSFLDSETKSEAFELTSKILGVYHYQILACVAHKNSNHDEPLNGAITRQIVQLHLSFTRSYKNKVVESLTETYGQEISAEILELFEKLALEYKPFLQKPLSVSLHLPNPETPPPLQSRSAPVGRRSNSPPIIPTNSFEAHSSLAADRTDAAQKPAPAKIKLSKEVLDKLSAVDEEKQCNATEGRI